MTDTITYCANECTRTVEGKRERRHAKVGNLCAGCVNRLEEWLTEIPERYALLPEYLLPSADLDANPETKATKKPVAPPPLRLAALDLLDTRRGRKWLATEPTEDRRGALGTLMAIANEVRIGRNSKPKGDSHVLVEADTIRNELTWLAGIEEIGDIYGEIKKLHRELGDAVGQYPPRAVGRCYIVPLSLVHDQQTCRCQHHAALDPDTAPCDIYNEGDETCDNHWLQVHRCNGALLPVATGVVCLKCDNKWDHNEVRLLGLALTEDKTA